MTMNEIASLWQTVGYDRWEFPLVEPEIEEMRWQDVPGEFIEWLSIDNCRYETRKFQHPADYKPIYIYNYGALMSQIRNNEEKEGEDLIITNGYLFFASEELSGDDVKGYVFDIADGSVRETDREIWISFEEIYEKHFRNEFENGQLDINEIYKDPETKLKYNPKSKYVKQFLEEKVFTGVRFDSFMDFLKHHIRILNQEK